MTPDAMQRLAFIRLLSQQGIEQSWLPEPLAATCILTLHDAVELFLILSSEHLGITVPEHGEFTSRFFDKLHPDKAGPHGVELSGRKGIKRLTVQRNTFKHDAQLPGAPAIARAREDAKHFFEDNTPKVFGVPFDAIDMVDLVPQQPTKDQLRAAATAWAQGDQVNGMGLLRIALEELFDRHLIGDGQQRSPLAFGPRVYRDPFLRGKVAKALTLDSSGKYAPVPPRQAEEVGRHLQELTEAVSQMQKALRTSSLGIDYHRLHRFELLTPEVYQTVGGQLEVLCVGPYRPSEEDYDYCQQFVVSAALRVAELEVHLSRPEWKQ
jgi:hypothetical protein